MQDLFSTELISRLATNIERHRQHIKATPDRRERLSALKDTIKLIDDLSEAIQTRALATAPAFLEGSLARLGALMSNEAIEGVAGSIAWMVDERQISDALARQRPGDVRFMDRLTRATRQAVSVQIGPKLLARLLDELKAPLEAALSFERKNKGGRPGLVYRNHVLEELARNYHTRTGSFPSTAKSGPFIEACHNVLVQLKIDPTGLEAALERAIKKLKT